MFNSKNSKLQVTVTRGNGFTFQSFDAFSANSSTSATTHLWGVARQHWEQDTTFSLCFPYKSFQPFPPTILDCGCSYKQGIDKARQIHGEIQVPTPPLHCDPYFLVYLSWFYLLFQHVCMCGLAHALSSVWMSEDCLWELVL